MHKIPLETALVGAYRFLFTNIVSIIGTLWLPFLIMVALIGGLICLSVPHDWLTGHFPIAKLQAMQAGTLSPDAMKDFGQQMLAIELPFLRIIPIIQFAGLVIGAMMFVGLMEHSLGLKTSTTFIYFSLGGKVWRMIGAFFVAWIILIVVACVLVGISLVLALVVVSMIPHAPKIALDVLIGIVSFCAFIYTVVRLTFFLPATVVAEGGLGLGRSWELGGGNFWRIFLIGILCTIPVGFVAGIIMQITIFPPLFAQIMHMSKEGAHPQPVEFIHMIFTIAPYFLLISLLQRVAVLGLLSGAIGTAYNAVTGSKTEGMAG